MRIVSTCHKAGWDDYGHKFLQGLDNLPHPVLLYTEGFEVSHPRLETRRLEDVERCREWKAQYVNYRPSNWRWNVVGFGSKVFAAYDALYDYEGLALWLDADCEAYEKVPDQFIEKMLPEGVFWAGYKRAGWPPETGFWLMDCSHPQKKAVLDTWIQWIETGSFKRLSQWCDAATLEATLRAYEKEGLIATASLSEGMEKAHHPMAMTRIAQYIDHLKGNRKGMSKSPENNYRRPQ